MMWNIWKRVWIILDYKLCAFNICSSMRVLLHINEWKKKLHNPRVCMFYDVKNNGKNCVMKNFSVCKCFISVLQSNVFFDIFFQIGSYYWKHQILHVAISYTLTCKEMCDIRIFVQDMPTFEYDIKTFYVEANIVLISACVCTDKLIEINILYISRLNHSFIHHSLISDTWKMIVWDIIIAMKMMNRVFGWKNLFMDFRRAQSENWNRISSKNFGNNV